MQIQRLLFGTASAIAAILLQSGSDLSRAVAQSAMLAGGRLFSFDQWGDYLIFNDPRRKVFIDGRSDFYGSELGNEYLDAMQAKWTWRKVLDKYGVDKVLSPVAWPLAAVLKQDPGWRLVADDGQAILFARRDKVGTPAAEVPRD